MIETTEPRNKRIKDMKELEREQRHQGAKRAKEIEEYMKGNDGEAPCGAEKHEKDSQSLSDFIEVIVRVPKK